jgi:quinol monooxygenase YgiN
MADFVIRADHYIKEGMLDDWVAMARVDAREAVKEPGCKRFDVFVERGSTTHAMFIEVYNSEADWHEHMKQHYVKTFMEGVGDMLSDKVRVEFDMVYEGGT